jgi:hypothetical protein
MTPSRPEHRRSASTSAYRSCSPAGPFSSDPLWPRPGRSICGTVLMKVQLQAASDHSPRKKILRYIKDICDISAGAD